MRDNLWRGIHHGERSPRLAGWGTQPLRVQRCATIPHCAPLERGDWMCRAAIDISLLWKGGKFAAGQFGGGAVSIVGRVLLAQRVGEPNPYGSSFACSRSIPAGFSCLPLRSPVAPLCAVSIMGRVHLAQRVGEPNPYGFHGVRQYHIALLWSAGIGCVALL